jgi:uncharacterized protein
MHTNRLIHAASPYLQQHAHNPVDWFPWGTEALELAKKENKPILVSIGYSACHWCHVMERECFEKEALAAIMNKHFVCIKVDREERPDVDQIYMEAVQAMGLQGGWPLNVFLTPDCRPFYGGTYFPPANWEHLLKEINRAWTEHPTEIETSAESFKESINRSEIQKYGLTNTDRQFEVQDLKKFAHHLIPSFDDNFGGFNRAPKFPMPSIWLYLLRYAHDYKDDVIMQHVHLTLNRRLQGGIYDTLKGGFARYSVDAEWFAPHFEKMLYDNGQLLTLYSEAFAQSHNEAYKDVVLETVDWLKTEMLHPSGGFFSALDADSEGIEGKFYVWEEDELRALIPAEDYSLFCHFYTIKEEGNWEHNFNILFRTETLEQFATQYKIETSLLKKKIVSWKSVLLKARDKRIRPGLDDKILASWNGLALKGLSDAARYLDDPEILSLAEKNAHFLCKEMMRNGQLYRCWKNGIASIDAYLEDYALVAEGLLALYEATLNEDWLNASIELTNYAIAHFYDEKEEMFFFTSDASESLIARKKEIFDNVIPSSNAVMATVLYRQGLLLYKDDWTHTAEGMLARMKRVLLTDPAYLTAWASLYHQVAKGNAEIILTGPKYKELRKEIDKKYFPTKILAGSEFLSSIPSLEGRVKTGENWIYYCQNKTCQMPVKSVEEMWGMVK